MFSKHSVLYWCFCGLVSLLFLTACGGESGPGGPTPTSLSDCTAGVKDINQIARIVVATDDASCGYRITFPAGMTIDNTNPQSRSFYKKAGQVVLAINDPSGQYHQLIIMVSGDPVDIANANPIVHLAVGDNGPIGNYADVTFDHPLSGITINYFLV